MTSVLDMVMEKKRKKSIFISEKEQTHFNFGESSVFFNWHNENSI